MSLSPPSSHPKSEVQNPKSSRWVPKTNPLSSLMPFGNDLGLSPILATLLFNRGIVDAEEATRFLNPSLDHLENPYLLPDMEKAVTLLRQALKKKQKILVYGDSDVDGVTGAALLTRTLRVLGGMMEWYVPGDEDYGLQIPVLERFIKAGSEVVITVDTGTSAHEPIAFANSLGARVIVTDHHLPSETLPEAWAIVNPHKTGSDYPFKGICGCFTAFKLAQGLMMSYGQGEPGDIRILNEPRMRYFLQDNLDLVSLAVLADVSPLLSENRVAVRHGLAALANSRKLGLELLLEEAGIKAGVVPTAKDISWKVIPLLNAAGRRGQSALACELLLTEVEYQAKDLVKKLTKFNDERRQIQKSHEEIFLSLIPSQCRTQEDKILVVASENLEMGVTGLVATGLVRKFHRPVVLLISREGQMIGSGRSYGGFDMVKAFDHCKDILLRYGGHRAAAGVALKQEHVPEFRRRLLDYVSSLPELDFGPLYEFEMELAPEDISLALCEELAKLAPFGPGNPSPVFRIKGCRCLDAMVMGAAQDHLKVWIGQERRRLECVGWSMGHLYDFFKESEQVDLLVSVEKNSWNGRDMVQLGIVDCRPMEG